MLEIPNLADQAQYRELFEEAPVAYHELDAEGVVRKVNRAECALLDVTASEMIGHPIWNFMPGEDRATGQAALARKLAGIQPLVPFRRVYVTHTGRYMTLEIHDRIMRDESGRAVGMRSALLDVTEQVEAETALRKNQQWLSAVLRSVSDPVFAVDALGLVKFMNPAAESLTGHRQADAQDTDIEEVLVIKALQSEIGQDTLEGNFRWGAERIWSGTITVVPRSGEALMAKITTSPIMTNEGVIMGWTLVLRLAPTDRPS